MTHDAATGPPLSWRTIETTEPDLARLVERRFGLGVNKTTATLRADGSPRISAIEVEFHNGEVTMGMMASSLKLRDVRRDPLSDHRSRRQPDWPGDGKIAGEVLLELQATFTARYSDDIARLQQFVASNTAT